MDGGLVFIALISFILFLMVVAVIFRFTKRDAAVVWIFRAFTTCVGIATVGVFLGAWGLTEYIWWVSLYALLVFLFTFGIFSIMEASLTLRIFTAIAGSEHGVTTSELLKKHNRVLIIRRRIERLVYSEELKRKGNAYTLGKTSYFEIREFVLKIFRFAFQKS